MQLKRMLKAWLKLGPRRLCFGGSCACLLIFVMMNNNDTKHSNTRGNHQYTDDRSLHTSMTEKGRLNTGNFSKAVFTRDEKDIANANIPVTNRQRYLDLITSRSTSSHTSKRPQHIYDECRTQSRVSNFVYIKNHKCASETLSAVFRRFAHANDLNVLLPIAGKMNLAWPWKPPPYTYRPSKRGRFNVLLDHTVFNETFFGSIMQSPVFYITSLREPFSHFKSSFVYFDLYKRLGFNTRFANVTSAVVEFLTNKDHYDLVLRLPNITSACTPPYLSIVRNLQSFNLGLPTGFDRDHKPRPPHKTRVEHYEDVKDYMDSPQFPSEYKNQEHNMTFVRAWLDRLHDKFAVVLIVEHLHESLVLLRRTFCWSLTDVLYVTRNTHHARTRGSVSTRDIPTHLMAEYREWSKVDSLLYDHFNRTLWSRIDSLGREDFMAEVRYFEELLGKVGSFCDHSSAGDAGTPLSLPPSPWAAAGLRIRPSDCRLLLSPSGGRQELAAAYERLPGTVLQPTPPGGGVTYPGC